MAGFRDLKRKMRRDVHRVMFVPALYYATPTSVPVAVTIRDHTKIAAATNGALTGGGAAASYAQTVEHEPKILFMVEQLPAGKPRYGAIVSVEAGEAYRVEAADPADDITVTAKVARLLPDDPVLALLTVP